ncbi:MAG TPA: carboxypeptidase-like regulatory domain-containing protein [Stellaceae bacterium]|nr:carboxypeptidase-like regulatory domain-containing protein [Stellaceae bacterium]
MIDAEMSRPLWHRLLANRFTVVLVSIALVIAIWNLYVSLHDHGVVEGRVVDSDGRPVDSATVTLWVLNFTTYVEKTHAITDADGGFVIRGNDSHNIQIGAEKPGVGRAPRIPVRLYFKGQDVSLAAPLVLTGG